MRYTAIAAILFGIVAACYAAFHFANRTSPIASEDSSGASLAIPLVFAAFLVIGGVLLWMVGGKGYSVSGGSAVRPGLGGPETFGLPERSPTDLESELV